MNSHRRHIISCKSTSLSLIKLIHDSSLYRRITLANGSLCSLNTLSISTFYYILTSERQSILRILSINWFVKLQTLTKLPLLQCAIHKHSWWRFVRLPVIVLLWILHLYNDVLLLFIRVLVIVLQQVWYFVLWLLILVVILDYLCSILKTGWLLAHIRAVHNRGCHWNIRIKVILISACSWILYLGLLCNFLDGCLHITFSSQYRLT